MKGFFHAGNTAGYTYEEIFFASIIRQAQLYGKSFLNGLYQQAIYQRQPERHPLFRP